MTIMTSYFRSFFGSRSQQEGPPSLPLHSPAPSLKTHARSSSSPAANYIYAPPVSNPSTPSSAPRLRAKRSNSYCVRTTSPSPLRFETVASHHNTNETRPARPLVEKPPMYRRTSYKSSERGLHYPLYNPSLSLDNSSRSNSSSSILPGMVPPAPPSTASSSGRHYSSEVRPPMRQNNTWHSGMTYSQDLPRSRSRSPSRQHALPPLHMHPLFASTRLHNAPISYDVSYTPSARTVLDRTTRSAVPAHTLSQPATDPPTSAMSRIILRSDKFPWPVVVGPLKPNLSSKPSFYVGSTPPSKSARNSVITNLDLLYALHCTLLTRVTPSEWEALGHGSRAQHKVTRAYEKRCTQMGGGWEGGVRRIDWLHGKTALIGIEVDNHGSNAGTGKLVFGKP